MSKVEPPVHVRVGEGHKVLVVMAMRWGNTNHSVGGEPGRANYSLT